MPPAFNLSQDQTLQFNSCLKLSLDVLQPLLPPDPQTFYFRASYFIFLRYCLSNIQPDQEPTPIDCLIFKELALVAGTGFEPVTFGL
jgi:hypothetical protein